MKKKKKKLELRILLQIRTQLMRNDQRYYIKTMHIYQQIN